MADLPARSTGDSAAAHIADHNVMHGLVGELEELSGGGTTSLHSHTGAAPSGVPFIDVSLPPYSVDLSGGTTTPQSGPTRTANTIGLQKAINDSKGSVGGVVYIPEGTFWVDDSLKNATNAAAVYGGGGSTEAGWYTTYNCQIIQWGGVPILGGGPSKSRAVAKAQWYSTTTDEVADADQTSILVTAGNTNIGPNLADDVNVSFENIEIVGNQKLGYNMVWCQAADSMSGIYRSSFGGTARSCMYFSAGPTNFVIRDTRADAFNEWVVDFGSRGDLYGLADQRIGFGPKNFLWDGMTLDVKNGSYADTSGHNYYGVVYATEVRQAGPAGSNVEGIGLEFKNLNIETSKNFPQDGANSGAEPFYAGDTLGSLFTFQLNEASAVPYSVKLHLENITVKGQDDVADNHNLVRFHGTDDADLCQKGILSMSGHNEFKIKGQILVGADGTNNAVPSAFETLGSSLPGAAKRRHYFTNYSWGGMPYTYGID